MTEVKKFLTKYLIAYNSTASNNDKLLKKIPLILVGDFNVNFNTEIGNSIITFLETEWNLQMSNNKTLPTTRNQTCIDAIFSRNVGHIETFRYVSYFSHHRLLLSSITNNMGS